MTTPDISVVVCTRNRAALLRGALASLYDLATEDEFTYEIVVIDNGSTDETPQVIAAAVTQAKHPLRGAVESELGIVAARNAGIRESQGRWIAFFDDDQLADWHWLAELHRGAIEKGCRVVGGSVQLALPAGCNRQLAPTVLMLLGESMGGDLPQRYGGRLAPGCGNLMVERSVFDQIGQFELAIEGRGEDADLYERMQRARIDAWYIPTAVIHHLTPAERLEREYLLSVAECMGRGIAVRKRKAFGLVPFACLWLAKFAHIVAMEYPRLLWAAMRGNAERILARRCELTIAQGFLNGAYHVESAAIPASDPTPAAPLPPSEPLAQQPAPVYILRSGEPTAVMDFQPLALRAASPTIPSQR
jgi:GT2 family glycosyltransferase